MTKDILWTESSDYCYLDFPHTITKTAGEISSKSSYFSATYQIVFIRSPYQTVISWHDSTISLEVGSPVSILSPISILGITPFALIF